MPGLEIRFVRVFLAIATIILGSIPNVAFAFLNGDVQGDGELNVSDVQCLVLAALDLEPDNPETTPACLVSNGAGDINCTGSLNVVDVQLVVALVLGALVPLDVLGIRIELSKYIHTAHKVHSC